MLMVMFGDLADEQARRCTKNIPHDNILPCTLAGSGTEYGRRLPGAGGHLFQDLSSFWSKYLPLAPVCSAAESDSKQ